MTRTKAFLSLSPLLRSANDRREQGETEGGKRRRMIEHNGRSNERTNVSTHTRVPCTVCVQDVTDTE